MKMEFVDCVMPIVVNVKKNSINALNVMIIYFWMKYLE
jgi:hypothetical protein